MYDNTPATERRKPARPIKKMKHLCITFILLLGISLSPLYAIGTEPMEIPDMEKIEHAVRDSRSPYYYPDLMKKYFGNDTTMTLQEFRHLYLGYASQEDYSPYRTVEIPQHIEQMYLQTIHTESECDSLIKYARMALDDIPFDLRQINFLVYGLRQKGETREADLWEYRLKGIIQAILSTGDGKAPETAWYVIYPADEYNIVNRQGFTATEFTFVEPYFDYISIEKNPLKLEGFYFNVKKLLKEYNRKFYDR